MLIRFCSVLTNKIQGKKRKTKRKETNPLYVGKGNMIMIGIMCCLSYYDSLSILHLYIILLDIFYNNENGSWYLFKFDFNSMYIANTTNKTNEYINIWMKVIWKQCAANSQTISFIRRRSIDGFAKKAININNFVLYLHT